MNKTNIDIDLEALAEASGENEVKGAPKLDLPILKLNGSKGNFTLLRQGKKIELDNEVEGVILKIRRCCTFYSKTKQMFSTEVNSNSDKMVLFEVFTKKNGDRSFNKVDEGTYAELKQRKPDLKFIQVIYFLMDGDVVKLQVKGGGLTNLFEYYRKFEGKEHMFQFTTKITTEQKTDPITYYTMVFERGEAVENIADVADNINFLAETLNKIDSFKKQKSEVDDQPPAEAYDDTPAPEDYEYQE
jgi:hypothetical protein